MKLDEVEAEVDGDDGRPARQMGGFSIVPKRTVCYRAPSLPIQPAEAFFPYKQHEIEIMETESEGRSPTVRVNYSQASNNDDIGKPGMLGFQFNHREGSPLSGSISNSIEIV